MQRKIEHIRRFFVGTPRLFAVAIGALSLSVTLFSAVLTLNLVTVRDSEGADLLLMTANEEPHDIIALAGLQASGGKDEIVYTAHTGFTASLVVTRSFPVHLEADGATFTAEHIDGTVEDLLSLTGIELGEEDFMSHNPDDLLFEDMIVSVHRVTYEEEELQAEVDDRDVEAYIKTLPVPEGADEPEFMRSNEGLYEATYRHRYIDGKLDSSEIIELLPVLVPREEGSTEFLPGVPVSSIDGFEGINLGADGIPTEYAWLMENAVCTAYSASAGKGASGLGLYYGTVAVNPNVIPYGSRMYITSADNSFVYGWAIATDTGGAMMEGRVDIDLFFETNAECYAFGKRALNVYVLEPEADSV